MADFVKSRHHYLQTSLDGISQTLTKFDGEVNPSDLLSMDEAVAELDISRSTLNRLIRDEGIPTYRRRGDRKTYVSRAAVAAKLGFRETRAKYGD
jgi:excisionase family DNA binding protein